MWGLLFVGLLLFGVSLFSWLEIRKRGEKLEEARRQSHAASVALESAMAEDKRRDDAIVATALDASKTVEAKRGSAPRPRSKVLDVLR